MPDPEAVEHRDVLARGVRAKSARGVAVAPHWRRKVRAARVCGGGAAAENSVTTVTGATSRHRAHERGAREHGVVEVRGDEHGGRAVVRARARPPRAPARGRSSRSITATATSTAAVR